MNEIIQKEIIHVYHNDANSSKICPNNFGELTKPLMDEYDEKNYEYEGFVNKANEQNQGSFLADISLKKGTLF